MMRFHVDTLDLRNARAQAARHAAQAALELKLTEGGGQGRSGPRIFFKLEDLRDAAHPRVRSNPGSRSPVTMARARARGGTRALALTPVDRAHSRGLDGLRACGRAHEQAHGVSRRHLEKTGCAPGGAGAEFIGGGQVHADGRDPGADARRRSAVKYSAMTGQALYYGEDLKHKILAIVEEEGAARASLRVETAAV